MKEDKKSFKEKWQDKKYQAKVKLSFYVFFVFVVILLVSIGGGTSSDNIGDTEEENINLNYNEKEDKEEQGDYIFKLPDSKEYSYDVRVTVEDSEGINNYTYSYKVFEAYKEIIKYVINENITYRVKDEKYFVLKNDKYVLTTKDEVFDIIDYEYIDIDNINNYLTYSELKEGYYYLNLKDIILDVNTSDYITFLLEDNKITVNYTNLVNYLENKEYDNYIVTIEYKNA